MVTTPKEEGNEEEGEEEELDLEAPYDEMIELRELQQDVRDITFKLRKQMNDLTMRMFLRTTINFRLDGNFEAK